MTADTERQLVTLLTIATIDLALKRAAEAKPMPIRPTMRPDPQAVTLSHGALISHAQA